MSLSTKWLHASLTHGLKFRPIICQLSYFPFSKFMTLFYSWGSRSLVFWLPLSPRGWLPCCRGPHTSGEAVFGIPLGPYIPCSRVTFLLSMRKCFSLIHSSSQSGFHSSTAQILRVSCNHFIFSPDATGLPRSCLDITVMALKPASRCSPLQTLGWVTESILLDLDSEKWNISCQMGKQSMSQSLQPLTDGELEGPEDTQGRKNTYHTAVQDCSHSPPGARRRLRMWKQGTGPTQLKCISKEWFQWAQTLASSHT